MTSSSQTFTTTKLLASLGQYLASSDEKRATEAWQRLIRRNSVSNDYGITSSNSVYVSPYVPYIHPSVGWLPVIQQRIRDSVIPNEYEGPETTEWLREDIANAAISFFQKSADILPTEPHIYCSNSGNLVAEFATEKGNLTTVVSDQQAVIFVSLSDPDSEPQHHIIRRGSNQFRDELSKYTDMITVRGHEEMVAAE